MSAKDRVIQAVQDLPDDIIYMGDGSEEDAAKYGREMQTHLTILYGMQNTNMDELSDVLEQYKEVSGTLGEMNIFGKGRIV